MVRDGGALNSFLLMTRGTRRGASRAATEDRGGAGYMDDRGDDGGGSEPTSVLWAGASGGTAT